MAAGMRGRVAIVGIGATAQGELPGRTADDISIEALRLALADAGLAKDQLDGLITGRSYGGGGIDTTVGRLAGLNPRYSATLDYGTCNFSLHLAAMAIAGGLASTVALTYGTNQRTAGHRFAATAGDSGGPHEPYGFFNIAGPAAMAFRRHAHLYGTTEEQLGHIAVTAREYAALNPAAVFRTPLSIEDYLAKPYLVEPLRRPDLCMISDGGVSLIVTSAERARELRPDPVYLLGMAQTTGLRQFENDDNLMRPWIRDLAATVHGRAGVDRADVDVLFLQDPTSVWVLQMLEWLGYCGVGEAGPFVAAGNLRLDGAIPTNTNGGQLSESYMWGWLHLVEAVRQVRGEAGPRQVAGARFAQYASTKGFEKAACSVIGTEVPA
jgi:acetyl-CoA acetyltransferase